MKKRSLFALGVAVLLLFSLVGCGAEPVDSADTPTTTITTTQVEQTTAPLTLVEDASPEVCYWYDDTAVADTNETVVLLANTDLTNLQFVSLYNEDLSVDEVLYTLPVFEEATFLCITTYINDAVPTRGVICTDNSGKTYYYAIAYSMKGDGSPSLSLTELDIEPLSEKKTDEIEAYLNAAENNGFVGTLNLFDAPEKASLYGMFYDGAGVGEWGSAHWDDAEQAAVLAACGWDEFHVPVLKIEAADVEQVLQTKLGVSYAQMEKTMEECGFDYVKAYDAYYYMHSDTNYLEVEVSAVTLSPEGLYVVEYTQPAFDAEDRLVVTLRADKAAGYQFVSNVKADTE